MSITYPTPPFRTLSGVPNYANGDIQPRSGIEILASGRERPIHRKADLVDQQAFSLKVLLAMLHTSLKSSASFARRHSAGQAPRNTQKQRSRPTCGSNTLRKSLQQPTAETACDVSPLPPLTLSYLKIRMYLSCFSHLPSRNRPPMQRTYVEPRSFVSAEASAPA
jgi:hypothetical protein